MAEDLPTISTQPRPILSSKINKIALIGLVLSTIDGLLQQVIGAGIIPSKWLPFVMAAESITIIILRTWFSGEPLQGIVKPPTPPTEAVG